MKRAIYTLLAAAFPIAATWLAGHNLNERGDILSIAFVAAVYFGFAAWVVNGPDA